jgi:hypothetical protein
VRGCSSHGVAEVEEGVVGVRCLKEEGVDDHTAFGEATHGTLTLEDGYGEERAGSGMGNYVPIQVGLDKAIGVVVEVVEMANTQKQHNVLDMEV